MLLKMDFNGNPYIGVYCATGEDITVVMPGPPKGVIRRISEALGTRVTQTTIGGSTIVGSLMSMNSQGAVVTDFVRDFELSKLEGLNVLQIPHRVNAAGNVILCNDYGAVIHPDYDDETTRLISKTLAVPAVRGTIAKLKTVGSAAVATNKGVVCHPHATKEEMSLLREILGVPVSITTANYGTAQVGACLIANSKGAVVGSRTTPIEMGRIEDSLGYLG